MTDQATTQREADQANHEDTEEQRLSTDDIAGSKADRSDDLGRDAGGDQPDGDDHPGDTPASGEAALFEAGTAKDLQARWQALQVEFVDEPRGAVEKADALVAEVMKQLAESFAKERRELESAWSGGREASTEDLRQAIRRYRSFFNRLLSI